MTTAEEKAPTARDLVEALNRHYQGGPGHREQDSHAVFTEVPHHVTQRRMDYLAVSLWASRGHRLDGHEIKVSRSDWLHELAQPSKAEAWWPLLHRWWLVVPDESLVHDGELPPGWGLMVPSGRRRMKVVVKPEERVPGQTPVWLLARLVMRNRADDHREYQRGRAEGAQAERERTGEREEKAQQRAALTYQQEVDLRAMGTIRHLIGEGIDEQAAKRLDPYDLAHALRIVQADRSGPTRFDGRNLTDHADRAEQYAARLREAAALAPERLGGARA